MRWAWNVGTIAGIRINVHGTFALLLAWVGFASFASGKDPLAAVGAVAFVVTIFAIVVLHELGHALTAKRFGIRTRDITLLPIGGVARLERIPEEPRQELLIALAGPAVNAALAAGGFLVLAALGAPFAPTSGMIAKLTWWNVAMAGFNLLPAFPLDGGRVFRAILATRLEYVDATRTAATVGQTIALALGLLGLLANPVLLLIAVFIWVGAAQEAATVELRRAVSGIPVGRAMMTEFCTLSPEDTLGQAAEHFLAGFQHDFPVVSDGAVVGVLTRADLLGGLARLGPAARVRSAMQDAFRTAEPAELLETGLERLQDCQCRALPVVKDGKLVGIFMPENVSELVGIRSAMRERVAAAAS